MATRKATQQATTTPVPASVTAEVGIELMQALMTKANALANGASPVEGVDVESWKALAREYLTRAFGSTSHNISAVANAGSGGIWMGMTDADLDRHWRDELRAKVKALLTCVEQLQMDINLRDRGKTLAADRPDNRPPSNTKIFVVHGHDRAMKESVARFLEKLGLEPIILHEQPNSGRTIIEKFADYSDVGFAVVLLTGDDEGRPKNSSSAPALRARQNVIFELGYFIGKLSRSHVCVLFEHGVEILSDYQGVLYTPLDEGGRWKFDLVRELRAAGFNVDANLAL